MSLPIIPWIGGKRRIAEQVLPLFPAHRCYVELFAGAAALYFLRRTPATLEVINDVNGDLINLYRVVQHHPDEFVRQFKWTLSSRETFDSLQDTPPETLTDIQRAARFYFLQQHAFGGKVTDQSFKSSATRPILNWDTIEKKLSAARARLASATLERLDWMDCLDRYDRPDTFFYCDPPYWKTEGYGAPFALENYLRLAEKMQNSQGKIMLSINDTPEIRRIFTGHQLLELEIKYCCHNQQNAPPSVFRELIITNWHPEKEFQLS